MVMRSAVGGVGRADRARGEIEQGADDLVLARATAGHRRSACPCRRRCRRRSASLRAAASASLRSADDAVARLVAGRDAPSSCARAAASPSTSGPDLRRRRSRCRRSGSPAWPSAHRAASSASRGVKFVGADLGEPFARARSGARAGAAALGRAAEKSGRSSTERLAARGLSLLFQQMPAPRAARRDHRSRQSGELRHLDAVGAVGDARRRPRAGR